ncbi:MAG: winged helix-turn-helix domain-containing protein, partial [Mesorhizobium sp.]
MDENGDLTLDELCVELEGRGVTVHRSNVSRLLHRLGLSHKKRMARPACKRFLTASQSAPTYSVSGQ